MRFYKGLQLNKEQPLNAQWLKGFIIGMFAALAFMAIMAWTGGTYPY